MPIKFHFFLAFVVVNNLVVLLKRVDQEQEDFAKLKYLNNF